jgi:AcrR family transcriptional regulator
MQPSSKRGRPTEFDRHHVSLVALRLFERNGFEQVTMDEVAEAASVSRRTLFRIFPSKADLVWDGLDEALDALKQRAALVANTNAPLKVLVDEIFAPILHQLDDPVAAKVARRRLRLIGASPVLFNHKTLEALQDVVTATVTSNAPPGGQPPSLVARSLVAVAFASVLWWAQQRGKITAVEALRGALMAVSQAHESPPAPARASTAGARSRK